MLIDKKKCTGCGSCIMVCPQKCLIMRYDLEGFRYPTIEESKCIHCGQCIRSCPILTPVKVTVHKENTVLAVKNRCEEVRMKSSSGGVFSTLAEEIIHRNGIVIAAGYDEDFSVKHFEVTAPSEIDALRGAKYSQSVTEHLFPEIQKALRKSQWVLFVGTPCQVAGLKGYLKKDYDTLISVDMICHGVPSPTVWKRYLDEVQDEYSEGQKIQSINQRCKESGWTNYAYSVRLDFERTIYMKKQNEDPFMIGFTNNLFLRPSCSNCSFKGINRFADITLGDFWGIWDQLPEFDDNKGVSLVIVHSAKGLELWQNAAQHLDVAIVDSEKAFLRNSSMFRSSEPHIKRDIFFSELEAGNKRFSDLVFNCLFNVNDGAFPRVFVKKYKSILGFLSKRINKGRQV